MRGELTDKTMAEDSLSSQSSKQKLIWQCFRSKPTAHRKPENNNEGKVAG